MAETTAHSTPVQSPRGVGTAVQVRAIPPLTSSDPEAMMGALNQIIRQLNTSNGNNAYGSNSIRGGSGGVGGVGGTAAAAVGGGGSRSSRNAGKPKQSTQRQKQNNPLDPGNQQFSNVGSDKKDSQSRNNNAQRPPAQQLTSSGQGFWREELSKRVVTTVKVTNKEDPSLFVEFERIDGFTMVNKQTGEYFRWSR